jgi:hypothetical protein
MDDQNIVLDVIVVNNSVINNLPFPQSEPLGVTFCQSLFGSNTRWLQTSYNGSFRGVYAGIGYSYDPTLDVFVEPISPEPPSDVLE